MLQIKNISKKFGTKIVISGVTAEIAAGSIGIFLGPSGTGKSTLLRIIAGLETYDTGSLVLDGKPLTPTQVGMVFQHFNLFENLTVLDNVTFGLIKGRSGMDPAQARIYATQLLTEYGLHDNLLKYPDELSGGQKQRLAIVRTIAQRPSVICFDEPTSALDPFLKNFVAQTLSALAQAGYTMVIATHDIQLVEQLACTLFLMHDGAIIESTTYQEFIKNPEAFPAIKKFIS